MDEYIQTERDVLHMLCMHDKSFSFDYLFDYLFFIYSHLIFTVCLINCIYIRLFN